MNLGLDTLITSSAPFLIVLQIWRPRVLGWHWLALYPSGFTQLSNAFRFDNAARTLCTPLDLHSSQTGRRSCPASRRLCTPLDLHSSQTSQLPPPWRDCFVPLWIYTALKPVVFLEATASCFVPLWIYTALKQCQRCRARGRCFVPLWIYTALKRR